MIFTPSCEIEEQTQLLGSKIFKNTQDASISAINPEFYTNKLMEWAMSDENFKIALFRFVDVLPSLRTSESIMRHVHEYFTPVKKRIPGVLRWALNISPQSPLARIVGFIIKKQIRAMAGRFILGETPKESLKKIKNIRKKSMAFSIDLLGEAALSEHESIIYQNRYIELIETLCEQIPQSKNAKPIITGHPCEKSPVNVSIKLTALYSQTKGIAFEKAVDILSERLTAILEVAKRNNCAVNIDMEDSDSKEIILETVKRVYTSNAFKDYDKLGLVFQAYLRDCEQDLKEALSWMKTRETHTTIRLVKGAYWDTETIMAKLNVWPIPVWQNKESSDFQYERLSKLLLDHHAFIIPAFGSHNIRSLCHAISYAKSLGLDNTDFEIQVLYGMADPIKKAFIEEGFLLREYAPIGELIPGMGYLVRRLLENTSNQGFIRQGFHENETPQSLLKAPLEQKKDTGTKHLNMNIQETFFNWPLKDFAISHNRNALQEALDQTVQKLTSAPELIHPIIGGKSCSSESIYSCIAPDQPSWTLAKTQMASQAQAKQAIEELESFFPTWRETDLEQRCSILFKTAQILEEKRSQITSIIILEAGKPWDQADADLCEAIDFLNYYALEAKKLFKTQPLSDLDGEDNFLFYEPRGLCSTIGPWNFPLAIPCGMLAAALVTGNCTIMKPAEQSMLVAWELFKAFQEAGLPAQAAAFLPGYGEEIGPVITENKSISTIIFTGSRDVGLHITKQAATIQKGQDQVKRVIAEMGGKNAIIIDDDADLDQAVKGVVHSAFDFAGQKCSACSRVIVLESAYEAFTQRLKEATKSLVVGSPRDPATTVSPVIDKEAQNRLIKAINKGKEKHTLLAQCPLPGELSQGFYVPPTVFTDVEPHDDLARDELFGPVLVVIKAKDFKHALDIANDTQYALTGSLYSRSPANLKQATRDFKVGNLYLNRPSTGAMVARQPFGGFKMSGVGSKTGGTDYLHQFVIPRAISESTIRQGFAPMQL